MSQHPSVSMTQNLLPFNYQIEKRSSDLTSFAGLPTYQELLHVTAAFRQIRRYLNIRSHEQGFTDSQILASLILLQLVGGDSVDDIERLRGDDGFVRVVNKISLSGLSRKERRRIERRWDRGQDIPAIPSVSVIRRWLNEFHNPLAERLRPESGAFIPEANRHLSAMQWLNCVFLRFMQKHAPSTVATLDMDATLIETQKSSSLYCYKGFSAYQPLNVWWAEQQMVIHTEFRDGNVPAGYEQLRLLKESLELLPDSVDEVRLRSDSAGYQHDLMNFCQQSGESDRKKIVFAIAGNVTAQFKKAAMEVPDEAWHPVYLLRNKGSKYEEAVASHQMWAEVNFVPSQVAKAPSSDIYRYIAIREPMQSELPGSPEPELPFATYKTDNCRYKLSCTVTNIGYVPDENEPVNDRGKVGVFSKERMWGESVIHWHRERCGRSEQAHSIMKSDFAGGKLPSSKFGANAAWWWITMFSLNLQQIMSKLVLGGQWENRRMKAIRFHLINIPARVLEHARKLFIRVGKGCRNAFDTWIRARARLMELAHSPG
ncbi:MAG: IS1380 family transposase [SAR324 cluster bacterium]|nr:IS1380 family transposase [SAR324 cluster bacterium]